MVRRWVVVVVAATVDRALWLRKNDNNYELNIEKDNVNRQRDVSESDPFVAWKAGRFRSVG